MAVLCLFDIDGTLQYGEKQHHAAFKHAWKKVYRIQVDIGLSEDRGWLKHQGKTDRGIILEVASEYGVRNPLKKIDEAIQAMSEQYRRQWRKQKLMLLPGARRLLSALQRKGVRTAIVTGNVEYIGRKKLKIKGINHFFCTGAFGDEANTRLGLISLAIKRAEKFYEKSFDKVFFFGDTVRDIQAAKRCRVRPMSVATGMFSKAELKKHKPYKVFANLADTEAVLHALGV
jgi:phosphoglycolate phosphatase-like HAD superfamily hydrolase